VRFSLADAGLRQSADEATSGSTGRSYRRRRGEPTGSYYRADLELSVEE